jgi:hypothetical protein
LEESKPAAVIVVAQSKDPDTTLQEDLTAAGKRRINLKWETTQQIIAIGVTIGALHVCGWLVIYGNDPQLKQSAFIFLTNIAFLVVGTYFQRTNHTKTGGVSSTDEER